MSRKNKRKSKNQSANNATNVSSSAATQSNVRDANSAKSKGLSAKSRPAKVSSKNLTPAKPLMNRRNMLKLLIGVPVVGAAGAAIHRHDVQTRGLHDLTAIGQGQPVVVQIHDPSCTLCRRLMKNTRQALKDVDNVAFKVADITTSDGESFRRKHNGQTVSLILFDAKGKQQGSVLGVTEVDELTERFRQL